MAHRRVVRVISYEGNDRWLDEVLRSSKLRGTGLKAIFDKHGTVKELQRVELRTGEWVQVFVNKERTNAEGQKD